MRKTEGTILANQKEGKNLRIHLWKSRMMKESGLGWTLQSPSLSILRCTGHSSKPPMKSFQKRIEAVNVKKHLCALRLEKYSIFKAVLCWGQLVKIFQVCPQQKKEL